MDNHLRENIFQDEYEIALKRQLKELGIIGNIKYLFIKKERAVVRNKANEIAIKATHNYLKLWKEIGNEHTRRVHDETRNK